MNFIKNGLILFALLAASTTASAAELGAPVPEVKLINYDQKPFDLAEFRGKIVVLEWYNPGCPFVKKHYKDGAMQELQSEITGKGVVWVTVNSSNPESSDYISPAEVEEHIKEAKIHSTIYVSDPQGVFGHAFEARTTPHMFVIDKEGKLAYRGAIDDRPGISSDPRKSENYVRKAVDELLAAKPITTPEVKSYGCSVKYK